jgi:hypothetical protein
MTPYQARFVHTIINTAKYDKDFARWSIAEFSRIDPYQLSNLKQLVINEIERRKNESK